MVRGAWERYLEPEKESELPLKEGPQVSTRPPPCNHSAFVDNSSVHQTNGGQEENAEFSNENIMVDRWTGDGRQNGGACVFSASAPGEDVPQNGNRAAVFRVCAQCNAGGEPLFPIPGTNLLVHQECRRFWAKANNGLPPGLDRTPALGPIG
jgi:hypothetical protein